MLQRKRVSAGVHPVLVIQGKEVLQWRGRAALAAQGFNTCSRLSAILAITCRYFLCVLPLPGCRGLGESRDDVYRFVEAGRGWLRPGVDCCVTDRLLAPCVPALIKRETSIT